MVMPGGQPGWRYSDTYPATFGGMGEPGGTAGNLASDPAFMCAVDDHLRAGSPRKDAADRR